MNSSYSNSSYTLETICSLEKLKEFKGDYNALWALSPNSSGFQHFDWIIACVENLPAGKYELFVQIVSMNNLPVLVLPHQKHGSHITWIGQSVSNYCSPVYLCEHVQSSLNFWCDWILNQSTIKSVDWKNIHTENPFYHAAISLSTLWGGFEDCATACCPVICIKEDWETKLQTHSSKQRSNWRRKWRRLSDLGDVRFREVTKFVDIEPLIPQMYQLFEMRWTDRKTSEGFSPALQQFHTAAIKTDAVRVSLIEINSNVVAFSYGIRSNEGTISYVLGHDVNYDKYSPGLLLLLKLLEAAWQRGDLFYDFSLGDMPYKDAWADEQYFVHRLIWGRGRRVRAFTQRVWTMMREVPLFKAVKQRSYIVNKLVKRQ